LIENSNGSQNNKNQRRDSNNTIPYIFAAFLLVAGVSFLYKCAFQSGDSLSRSIGYLLLAWATIAASGFFSSAILCR
jgi:EamA domain-containing membrane protein RarD